MQSVEQQKSSFAFRGNETYATEKKIACISGAPGSNWNQAKSG